MKLVKQLFYDQAGTFTIQLPDGRIYPYDFYVEYVKKKEVLGNELT